jgi:dUTP pyrophosphatase
MAVLRIKMLADIDLPGYAHPGDAGIDLRASGVWVVNIDEKEEEISGETYTIMPGERILVKTGIIAEIPEGNWGNIRDRSGLAKNYGLHVLAGVIDETYRGEIGVVIVNLGKREYVMKRNERIAQMIVMPYSQYPVKVVEDIAETERSSRGFGSSGKN